MMRPETPTLDLANQHVTENRALQRFLVWLQARGCHIGRPAGSHAGPCLNFEGQDPDDYSAGDSCYLHVATPQCVQVEITDRLLADFWGLDLEQLAAERAALLAYARSNQAGQPSKKY